MEEALIYMVLIFVASIGFIGLLLALNAIWDMIYYLRREKK